MHDIRPPAQSGRVPGDGVNRAAEGTEAFGIIRPGIAIIHGIGIAFSVEVGGRIDQVERDPAAGQTSAKDAHRLVDTRQLEMGGEFHSVVLLQHRPVGGDDEPDILLLVEYGAR